MKPADAIERAATLDDAQAMTRLVDMAGEGLPFYLWSRMAGPGEDPWEIGRQRARRESGGFSYRNTTILERAGRIIAGMIGYPLPDEPPSLDLAGIPPMFVPLEELEQQAPATWYVNVLAVVPEERRCGHGRRLLAVAEQKARASSRRGMSIIVSDANDKARQLYESCGYREAGRRAMVKEDWANPGQHWVLLTKAL
ncbi:MAG TPA: GNAT family N-acetyltransferase [Geminicoccus sp.]|jgi:ribosomal protein S18 acetylase RimI-like enzyme|uniref:GNAT family N-acetyltransferase n=1 Tax=Geminicoccus sp. TaxID=2024832 RepID=UPI002E37649C|nr:GNAT family N-acetyltransferase [Geminicoccus sp.]HEX2528911.1 GNAT family N-acetyltransferase [Geminicoccus sp.]